VFFTVVGATPTQVNTADVLRFIEAQRQPRNGNVIRLVDGEAGMAASTIKRRLASVSGLFDYLTARGLVAKNPVPRSLSARPGRAPLPGQPAGAGAATAATDPRSGRSRPAGRSLAHRPR